MSEEGRKPNAVDAALNLIEETSKRHHEYRDHLQCLISYRSLVGGGRCSYSLRDLLREVDSFASKRRLKVFRKALAEAISGIDEAIEAEIMAEAANITARHEARQRRAPR